MKNNKAIKNFPEGQFCATFSKVAKKLKKKRRKEEKKIKE